MSNNTVVTVENLRKVFKIKKGYSPKNLFNSKYEDTTVLEGISFNIDRGEFVGLIGVNGAGKSTTLKCLSGLLRSDDGSIDVCGFCPSERSKEYLRKIAFVTGNRSQLCWELPAMESFLLNKEIYEIESGIFEKNLNEMVDLLNLGDIVSTVPVRKLSLGERMKCEIVVSLLHRPEVLFLDEPTIGLDILSQDRLKEFLKSYVKRHGATAILTSHNMDDVRDLCERVLVLNDGRLIYDGSVSSLMCQYISERRILFRFGKKVGKGKFLEALGDSGKLLAFDGVVGSVCVPVGLVTSVISKILENFLIEDVDIEEVSLRDVVRRISV